MTYNLPGKQRAVASRPFSVSSSYLPSFIFCLLLISATLSARAAPLFDAEKVENWADAYFGEALADRRITGAALGVTQDGETLFLKGCGWQHLEARIPVDPQTTQFRMCSTSKTYTATALLQLVERGRIRSLDAPINPYLKRFRLPPPYGDDVTARHLVTQSSGMTGTLSTPQGAARDIPAPVDTAELVRIFKENMIRPPGELLLYSNLGVALEGALIEDVAGQPLAAYMRRELFEPLDMKNSLMHHAVTPPENIATPFAIFPNGALQEIAFTPKHPATAASGGVIATPEDMLKYLAFHADEKGERHEEVLSGERRRAMHQRQFGVHPAQAGVGLQFFIDRFNNRELAWHSCGLPGTTSYIGVFPGARTAFSISVLAASPTPSAGDLLNRLFGKGRLVAGPGGPSGAPVNAAEAKDAFLDAALGDRAIPAVDPQSTPKGRTPEHDALAGTYWSEGRSKNTIIAFAHADATRRVTLDGADRLLIDGAPYQRTMAGAYDLLDEEGRVRDRVIFTIADSDGRVLLSKYRGASAYRQVSGLEDPGVVTPLFLIGMAVSLTGFGAAFWSGKTPATRAIKWAALSLGGTLIALPVALTAGYDTLSGAFMDYYNNELGRMRLVVFLLNLNLLLGAGLAAATVAAWRWRAWGAGAAGLVTRSHLTLLAAGAALTWPAFALFNLIGFNLR